MIKTIHQYNRKPIASEDMAQLAFIAGDYRRVRQYVYDRYGGIHSIGKLYPGYTIQNEMTACGLRQELEMPSVYYYLAIYDALSNIKSEWSRVCGIILKNITAHEHFTPEERHYLRYVLKMDRCYQAILQYTEYQVSEEFLQIIPELNFLKLNNYLRRQTRRHLKKLHTDNENSFRLSERAYRYADGGIYISTKESRRRIHIPLTDNNQYTRQLLIRLHKEKGNITIDIPVTVKKKAHGDYQNKIGLSVGYHTMYISSTGNEYGRELGTYSRKMADWIRERNRIRSRIYRDRDENREQTGRTIEERAMNITRNNLGMKKYQHLKQRYEEGLRSYVNREINRMLREEKPAVIYIPKLPRHISVTHSRQLNHTMTLWRKGYIRERLWQKCEENAIEIVEVFGRDISSLCHVCGTGGSREEETFFCPRCGNKTDRRVNAARNALNRGLTEGGNREDHKYGALDE